MIPQYHVTSYTPWFRFVVCKKEMEKLLFISLVAVVCGQSTYDVDDTGGLGRQYDGIGGLSGGGVRYKPFYKVVL